MLKIQWDYISDFAKVILSRLGITSLKELEIEKHKNQILWDKLTTNTIILKETTRQFRELVRKQYKNTIVPLSYEATTEAYTDWMNNQLVKIRLTPHPQTMLLPKDLLEQNNESVKKILKDFCIEAWSREADRTAEELFKKIENMKDIK